MVLSGDSWVPSIVSSIILNLIITGAFAFLGFAWPTQRLLPSFYYKIKRPKQLKFIYQLLKVELFKRMLLMTFWKDENKRKSYFNGQSEGLPHFIEQTQKSEFGHLIPFMLITLLCLFLLLKGFVKLAVATFVFNCIFNGYPIILQRHHRMRVQRFYKILQARAKNS